MQKLPLPDEHPLTVSALRNARSKIVGDIDMYNREISRLRATLIHLDATLKLFDPQTDPEEIPGIRRVLRTRSDYFARGELTDRVYAAMRTKGLTSAKELADEAMEEKGISEDDRAIRKEFMERFGTILHNLRRRGAIEKVGEGRGVRWKLAPQEPDLI